MLAHYVMELVHHLPYWLVVLPAKLMQDFIRRYSPLCTGDEEHCHEPVKGRELVPLHHRAGTNGSPTAAVHVRPRLVARILAEVKTTAIRAKQRVAFTKLLEGSLTCLLVWVYFIEISQVHKQFFPLIINKRGRSVLKGI